MNEIMDRLATGEYAAYKRYSYAKYWLGGGLALAFYTAVSATFDSHALASDFVDTLPFYLPILIGSFLSPFARDAFSWNPIDCKYDEFETDALNTARSHAYWYILLIMLTLSLWMWIGTGFGFPVPSRPYDWQAIFSAFIAIGIAMPAFVAECIIPIPPTDGDNADDDS